MTNSSSVEPGVEPCSYSLCHVGLQVHPSLRNLKVSNVSCDEAACELADGLKANTLIADLSLGYVSCQGVTHLGHALSAAGSITAALRSLELQHCK